MSKYTLLASNLWTMNRLIVANVVIGVDSTMGTYVPIP